MRAVFTTVLLLALAAPAAARPLDMNRSFARNGVLRLDEPAASLAVIALPDGGTLHATDGHGIMRLDVLGQELSAKPLAPAGAPTDLVAAPGGALVVGTPSTPYGTPTPLGVWRVDREGQSVAYHQIALPKGESAHAQEIVRRGDDYAVLVNASGDRSHQVVVALTQQGTLESAWGKGGFRDLPGERSAIAGRSDRGLVVATAKWTRCQRTGYTSRRERAYVAVRSFDYTGSQSQLRRHRVGQKKRCPASYVGDVDVDSSRRVVIAGNFGEDAEKLIRLRRDLRRDPRFGRRGVAIVARRRQSWTGPRVERRPGGGYAFGFTAGPSRPRAVVGLIDRRGRRGRSRRLPVSRNYPSASLDDIVIDRRGGLVAAGALHDLDFYLREDYGQPHLAVWRVRTT